MKKCRQGMTHEFIARSHDCNVAQSHRTELSRIGTLLTAQKLTVATYSGISRLETTLIPSTSEYRYSNTPIQKRYNERERRQTASESRTCTHVANKTLTGERSPSESSKSFRLRAPSATGLARAGGVRPGNHDATVLTAR